MIYRDKHYAKPLKPFCRDNAVRNVAIKLRTEKIIRNTTMSCWILYNELWISIVFDCIYSLVSCRNGYHYIPRIYGESCSILK